jgi:hypothetical protein
MARREAQQQESRNIMLELLALLVTIFFAGWLVFGLFVFFTLPLWGRLGGYMENRKMAAMTQEELAAYLGSWKRGLAS